MDIKTIKEAIAWMLDPNNSALLEHDFLLNHNGELVNPHFTDVARLINEYSKTVDQINDLSLKIKSINAELLPLMKLYFEIINEQTRKVENDNDNAVESALSVYNDLSIQCDELRNHFEIPKIENYQQAYVQKISKSIIKKLYFFDENKLIVFNSIEEFESIYPSNPYIFIKDNIDDSAIEYVYRFILSVLSSNPEEMKENEVPSKYAAILYYKDTGKRLELEYLDIESLFED